MALNSDSETVSCLAIQYLQHCLSNHEKCKVGTETSMPTRVIDVGLPNGSKPPFLYVLSSEERYTYAALSYCWGKVNTDHVLTKATLPSKQKEVAIFGLPQTLQDAIQITRNLQIRYLWTDALCIIQDSVEDWEIEAARMGDVYSNALVTIAAGAASSCTQGIFAKRDIQSNGRNPRLAFRGPDRSLGNVFLRRQPCSLRYEEEPLKTRGWTLQERLLSPRVLYYGVNQLIWECKTEATSEGVAFFQEDSEHATRTGNPLLDPSSTSQANRGDFQHSFYYWCILIEDFTRRQLTVPSDRLPALSGLANRIHATLGADCYLAGIWATDLPYALLWDCIGYSDMRGSRIPDTRTPSWSWASVNCPVRYSGFLIAKEPTFAVTCHASTTLAGKNLYGSVTSGIIKLRSVLKMVEHLTPVIGQDYDLYNTRCSLHADFRDSSSLLLDESFVGKYLGRCWFDDYDEMKELCRGNVWCLAITEHLGLLLATDDDAARTYRRVGYYELEKEGNLDWFQGCGLQVVTIV